MRCFEKVSLEEFKKYYDMELYDFNLPSRSTGKSAGYDFYAVDDCTIKRGESKKIISGVKANMENNDVLFLVVRSSMGFKYNVRMCNQVGVIDSDYYNNTDNERHIWIKLKNEGDKDFIVKNGDAICQGIFLNYLTVTNERDVKKIRNGGLGSTNGGKDER